MSSANHQPQGSASSRKNVAPKTGKTSKTAASSRRANGDLRAVRLGDTPPSLTARAIHSRCEAVSRPPTQASSIRVGGAGSWAKGW